MRDCWRRCAMCHRIRSRKIEPPSVQSSKPLCSANFGRSRPGARNDARSLISATRTRTRLTSYWRTDAVTSWELRSNHRPPHLQQILQACENWLKHVARSFGKASYFMTTTESSHLARICLRHRYRVCGDEHEPRLGFYAYFAAQKRPSAELSHRLCDTPLSVWRLASIYPLRSCTCRIHPADHALASRAAFVDLALSDERQGIAGMRAADVVPEI